MLASRTKSPRLKNPPVRIGARRKRRVAARTAVRCEARHLLESLCDEARGS